MSTEVILMENIDGLGAEGQVVRVTDGYARNYLLPRKLAAPVTEATRRQIEKKRKERETQLAGEKADAEKLAAVVAQTSCTITVKTGDEGKMYGSVTAADVLKALASQGIQLGKHQLLLEEPIRELGVFNLPVKLHPSIETQVKVWVVEE